jgi:hypothetical protein
MVTKWSTWVWLTALAAVGPTVLWAVPSFGPARDFGHAGLLLLAYPSWLLFSLVSLAPGIVLAKQFELDPQWVVPLAAVLTQVLIGGVTHWPPTQWWPTIIVGQLPVPSGYVLGVPVEAWHNYFYSLWPDAFMALVAATVLLVIRRLFGFGSQTLKGIGIWVFLVGLTWFARFSYSLGSYVLAVVIMGGGALLAFAGSVRWNEFFLSTRQYFRMR